ncbi:MAG: hypothetical protein Alpg2KO_29170 [Alphaproteobacteria bacterium]
MTVALLGSADNPAINFADNDLVDLGNTTAPNGTDRIAFLTVDIGAFEFPTGSSISDNSAPTLTVSSHLATDDGDVGTGFSFTTSDDNNNILTVSLSGDDEALFELDDDNTLLFRSAPDPASPADANGDGEHELRITSSDGFEDAWLDLVIKLDADGDLRSEAYDESTTLRELNRLDVSDSLSWHWMIASYNADGNVTSRNFVYDDDTTVDYLYSYDGVLRTSATITDGLDAASRSAWSEIVDTYDADGNVLTRDYTFDDGTTQGYVFTYDGDQRTGATITDGTGEQSRSSWSQIVETYDADGNTTSRNYVYDDDTTRSYDYTYVDGDRVTATVTDGMGDQSSASWSVLEYTYNSDGTVNTLDYSYDNGNTRSYSYEYESGNRSAATVTDGTGEESSASWSVLDYTYDADGNVLTLDYTYDDGTSRNYTYTYADSTLTARSIMDGDGSASREDWSMLDQAYNMDGTTSTLDFVYDNGTTRSYSYTYTDGTRTSATITDGDGAQSGVSWSEAQFSYDDDGDLIERIYLYDDGDRLTETIEDGVLREQFYEDLNDDQDFTSWTRTYDETGTLVDTAYIFDM